MKNFISKQPLTYIAILFLITFVGFYTFCRISQPPKREFVGHSYVEKTNIPFGSLPRNSQLERLVKIERKLDYLIEEMEKAKTSELDKNNPKIKG